MLLSSLALAAANAAADAPGTRDRGAPLLPLLPLPLPLLLLPPDSGGMDPAAPLGGAADEAMAGASLCSCVVKGRVARVVRRRV